MCKETSADGNCCHIVTTSTTSAVTTTTTIIDTINNFSAHFSTGKHWYNDNMGYHKQEQQTDECQCDLHHRLHQYQQHFSACKCGPYGDSQKGLAGRNCCYAKGRIIPAVVNIAGKSAMPRKAKRTKTKRTKWHKFIHSLTSYFHTNILLFLVLFTSGVHSQANAPLEYYLSEELPADTVVGNLVQDLSLDTQYTQEELDQMRFTVSDNTGQSNLDYFAIDNIGGIIKTTKSIDREEICFTSIECSVNLKVLVSPAQYFQVIKVIVHITDRNDHVPTFPQRTFSKSIPETTLPGAAFPLPIADDFDSGVFGVQRYRLYGDRSKFSLRITNGSDGIIEDIRLLLLQSLDREEQESYAMRVVASDGGTPPESGTMSILITVTDTNDNNPKFDNDTYEVVIPENTASHTTIVQVHASDPDSGRNGEIMYSFAEDTLNKYGDLFEIDSLTGEIYLSRVVDYEEGEIYYLSAVARDRGDNSLPAFARVVVKVRDVNDHAPHITLNFLEEDQEIAQVLENSDIGTFVAHVSVSDPDGGRMGQVTCSMQSPYFQLEQLSTAANEYKIVTRVVFDREVRGNYEVTVKCEDKGQPPLEAIEAIPIFIIDENDHQPQFWKSLYRSTILENNDKQAYIARVNATDGDSDGNAAIKYELANNEDKKVLYVDPINGIITAKVSFDYEKQSEYSFPLIAYDQGTPSRTATTTLSLSIIDRNDEPPKFTENSYVFSVQEGQDGDAPVGQVTATDEDSHPFNDVKYSFWKDPGGASELFKIDELTGTIRTKVKLDREEKSEYRLKVLASNEGFQDMTSTVDVTIKVGDENDNAPIFDFPNSYNNTLQVAVLLPKGRVVAQARAHDPDMDSNSQITFSLANDNNTFKIDPKNGYITVEAKLTEVECKICKMWVIATDSGQKPKSSREEVSIILSAGFGKTSSQKSSHVYLSPTELIIICAVGSSVVLIIVVIIIIFTVKRCDKNKQKKQQYTAGTHHDNSVEPEESSTASKCSDCCSPGHVGGGGGGGAIDLMQQKPSQNGQCGKTGGDRPKKEVKFLMDNGGTHTGESSTDDFPPSWPSHIGSDLIQNPKAHSTALGSSDSSEVQDDDKLGPLWHDQPGAWNQANHHRNPAGTSGALPVPPPPPPPATCITRSSPVAPLTEMELEMHEMLQMFGRDKDSETGSFTDSGRGPSEEGDTRPCPLDPKLNDDHKGAMLRSTDHSQRGIGNHYRPSDSTMGRRLNALPKSSSFGTAPGMKNFCLHDRGAHPTIHGVKPPMYNTSYIPVPSVDKVHRMQHQHSADSTGSGSESGVTWSDTNKVTNHRSPSRGAGVGGGVSGQLPARTGILKFAHTNRRPNDPSGGSKTLPHKSGSLDSGIQGGPEANRQHIPVPNTFQGPYHGNIDKQRSQPSSVAGSRAGSSQSLNVNPQPMYQGQGHMNRNSFYNNSRTLSPSHRTCSSSLQGAQNPLMDADSKSRSPKLDRLPGASSQVYPSKGLYDNPSRYGAKTADWGNESVLSDDGTCASTTSGSYMVEPDNISQDTTTRSSFRDDKKDPLHQQTMV